MCRFTLEGEPEVPSSPQPQLQRIFREDEDGRVASESPLGNTDSAPVEDLDTDTAAAADSWAEPPDQETVRIVARPPGLQAGDEIPVARHIESLGEVEQRPRTGRPDGKPRRSLEEAARDRDGGQSEGRGQE